MILWASKSASKDWNLCESTLRCTFERNVPNSSNFCFKGVISSTDSAIASLQICAVHSCLKLGLLLDTRSTCHKSPYYLYQIRNTVHYIGCNCNATPSLSRAGATSLIRHSSIEFCSLLILWFFKFFAGESHLILPIAVPLPVAMTTAFALPAVMIVP